MTYDDWKTETPEDEEYRLGAYQRKQINRAVWMEEHEDMLREDRDERLRLDTKVE